MFGVGNTLRVRPRGSIIHGHHFILRRLISHVTELGVLLNQLDHLPLDNLIAKRIHQVLLLQSCPHAAGRLVGLVSDQLDLLIKIVALRLDLLFLGDLLQDEVLLQRPGRRGHRVLMQLVHVRLNLIVREAAGLQLHIRPLQLPAGLAAEQILRQVPRCGCRCRDRDDRLTTQGLRRWASLPRRRGT